MSHEQIDAPVYEQVEHAILQVAWLGQRRFMQLLAEERFDLTVPQFYTLLHLASYESECKMSDLARATHQSAASLTGVIDRLIDKRLVARERSEGDRRQVTVTVTERGVLLLHEVKHARSEHMQSAFSGISIDEITTLLRLLDSVCGAMSRQIEAHE
jgi:DNA-binding MarR family transcriptional regulator